MSAATKIEKMDRWVHRLDGALIACGVVALCVSACMLFIQVILRYWFGMNVAVFEDLAENLVVWCVMFLAGPAAIRGSHVGMEFVAEKVKGTLRTVHRLVVNTGVLMVCAFLVWKGVEVITLILPTGQTTFSGELEIGYMMIPIPLGAATYGLFLCSEIVKHVCCLIDPSLTERYFPARAEESKQPTEGPTAEA
jgi:TRAP-type C4-dicarboxylate transport system permease small subunit